MYLNVQVRSERNQQIMTELCPVVGDWASVALVQLEHPLHPPLQYIYDRLAAHQVCIYDRLVHQVYFYVQGFFAVVVVV